MLSIHYSLEVPFVESGWILCPVDSRDMTVFFPCNGGSAGLDASFYKLSLRVEHHELVNTRLHLIVGLVCILSQN